MFKTPADSIKSSKKRKATNANDTVPTVDVLPPPVPTPADKKVRFGKQQSIGKRNGIFISSPLKSRFDYLHHFFLTVLCLLFA